MDTEEEKELTQGQGIMNNTNTNNEHPRPGARVFMTNMGFHDYSAAERWGEFVPLTQGRVDLVHTDRLEGEIQAKLADFNASDYLMLGGAPIVVAMCVLYIMKKFNHVDIIYWDAMFSDYRYRRLTGEDRNERLLAYSGR